MAPFLLTLILCFSLFIYRSLIKKGPSDPSTRQKLTEELLDQYILSRKKNEWFSQNGVKEYIDQTVTVSEKDVNHLVNPLIYLGDLSEVKVFECRFCDNFSEVKVLSKTYKCEMCHNSVSASNLTIYTFLKKSTKVS